METIELAIIAPTYNEGEIAKRVIEEWHAKLKSLGITNYKFLLIDDGSTDRTAEIAATAKISKNNMEILQKSNSGHGRSCIWGYYKALELKPNWIFQIDSDGQCDPCFFEKLWQVRSDHEVIYGYRKKREDGLGRLVLSRLISILVFFFTIRFSRDPNVPYRLLSYSALSVVLKNSFIIELSNMLLTYKIQEEFKIHWVDISFRKRYDGESSHKLLKTLKSLIELIRSIR